MNLNYKKAQVGTVGIIFLFIMFNIIWFTWLGGWVNEQGLYTVTANNLTGFEAFFYSNLNLFILICEMLGMIGFVYFSGVK